MATLPPELPKSFSSDTSVAILKRNKTTLKARVTSNLNAGQEATTALGVENHIQVVRQALADITQVEDEYQALMVTNGLSEELMEWESSCFEEYLSERVGKLELLQSRIAELTPLPVPPATATPDGSSASQGVNPNILGFKLPEVKIQPFDNNDKDPFQYSNFYSAFTTAMSPFTQLSDAQKFLVLKSNLRGTMGHSRAFACSR